MRTLLLTCFLVWLPTFCFGADRPNILWITAEDMSPTLGCYGDDYATTPQIDGLARESVRYTRAFATAPVCSPVRSSLITGCYAPSLGTHNMRSAFPLPKSIRGFPSLLRKAGYYTTNNVKTDYNALQAAEIIKDSWDDSSASAHWRNKKSSTQPFFAVFNLMTSHQSRTMVWPHSKFVADVQARLSKSEIHDPERASPPPYYPDTPVVRREWARFYDCVTVMDKQVGDLLRQLAEDGLDDETIVFFFSDHGSGMPRHKRALLDSGMRVPLLVRFPEKYGKLAPVAPGQVVDRLVSFIDFPPTILSLAKLEAPRYMQGIPFLASPPGRERRYAFGHRDRVDEAFDMARSARDKQYLYIRNYLPHLSYNQPTAWPDQGEIRREFYRMASSGKMTAAQRHFAGPTRSVEELYDCDSDPLNLRNLAHSAPHQETLQRMRRAVAHHVEKSRDVGFLPEAEMRQLVNNSSAWELARNHQVELKAAFDAANQVGVASESQLLRLLHSEAASVRYWGVVGLRQHTQQSPAATKKLRAMLRDPSPVVRVESAAALASSGQTAASLQTLIELLASQDLNVVLYAMRTIELIGKPAASALPAARELAKRCQSLLPTSTTATFVQSPEQDLAMFIGFSANAFVARVTPRE